MKMWYANESDSRKRNGGARAPEGSREGCGEGSGARSHKVTMHTDPSTPGCPAWRASELPLPQPEDRPEVICAPLARAATWTCRPQAVSAASPSSAKSLAIAPTARPAAAPRAKFPPMMSPFLRPWRRPPRRPAGHPRPTRGELTRPGVFLRSFSCSPRRLSRGVQPGSLHLPVHSPPFTSPTSPDLVVEGGS